VAESDPPRELNHGRKQMTDLSALFFLVALVHGNGEAFSISELASFPTEVACNQAVDEIKSSLRDGANSADIGCISGKAIAALKGR
jgi:hypothetical protein